jgi:hypothetical protein
MDDSEKSATKKILESMGGTLAILFAGWVAHKFMGAA